jgi:hypothetical protein
MSGFNSVGIDDNAEATAITIDSSGAVTMPNQPAFFAYLSSNADNVIGNGVRYTVICDTETFDQNADYDTSNGTFTAPVSGRYYIQGQISTGEQIPVDTDAEMRLVTSNRTVNYFYSPANDEGSGATGQCSVSLSGVFDMDASDTLTMDVKFYQGEQDSDVHANNTWMSAALIC